MITFFSKCSLEFSISRLQDLHVSTLNVKIQIGILNIASL